MDNALTIINIYCEVRNKFEDIFPDNFNIVKALEIEYN